MVTALAIEVQDEENRMRYLPNLVGKKLPGDIPQYFNVVGFTRKSYDEKNEKERYFVMTRSTSGIIDTKSHAALDSEEEPNVAAWVEKISVYWEDKNQGGMPTESAVTRPEPEFDPAEQKHVDRVDKPEIKALFDKLGTPIEHRIIASKKYMTDKKLIEVIEKRIDEQEEE
jgi:hypothetical protein